MKKYLTRFVLFFVAIIFLVSIVSLYLLPTSGDIIHEKESPYQTIYISEANGIRRMHVGSLLDRSSAMDLNDPYRHVYEYTGMMMLVSGYVDAPKKILVVGLGGGTVTRTLRMIYPDAEITNVEFDPEIVAMARQYFGYAEDAKMKLVVEDARRWLRRTTEQFDVILLDAYHGGYIPFHLTTREFLEIVRERLSPGGVVCSNTWTNQALADRESATYHAVFGGFHHYIGKWSTNRIIVAAPSNLPSPEEVRSRIVELEVARKPERLDLKGMFDNLFESNPTWPASTKILTDDHAPVNLLKDEK
ncbi:MAG: fused MFS/spermidine synthase [Desulfomicrobium sp.]|nr:fused MFS/spermidine synthase [Pseudomonadota bacterium]MBV1710578.1 fused MFS/spermidine synthase [Desulfomicrobium sp.]MBU4570186.1 fused MFS/spermidine synthase [Pseudomonadota bacterium]MBU4593106.1 fused MFS/spermidine synthase [Pseudomonadota bacterium]MBV1720410.1 fused MFS/spermidine synthase [Desulfomicrobium sp.]